MSCLKGTRAPVLNELPFNSIKCSLGLAAWGRINIASATGNKVALAEKICLWGKLVWNRCYWWLRYGGNISFEIFSPTCSVLSTWLILGLKGLLKSDRGIWSPLKPNHLSLCKEQWQGGQLVQTGRQCLWCRGLSISQVFIGVGVCPSLKDNEIFWWGHAKASPSFSRASAFIKKIIKIK